MKGKLYCCLQDMGTLRGNMDKGAAGRANRGWSVRTMRRVGLLWWSRGQSYTPASWCVCSGRNALCVVRQLGRVPGVVASAHSRWELEEVGRMSIGIENTSSEDAPCSRCQEGGSAALVGWDPRRWRQQWRETQISQERASWNPMPGTPYTCPADYNLQRTSTFLI